MKYHLLALAVVAVWGVTFVSTKVLIGAGMQPAAIGSIAILVGVIWALIVFVLLTEIVLQALLF